MKRRGYQVYDRDGRHLDDDVGIVPDGGSVHVPLTFMDGVQRSVARDAKRRRKVVQRDPMGRVRSTFEEEEETADAMMFDAGMHRPGFRFSSTADDSEAVKAYREYCDAQCNAWKKRDVHDPK